MAAGLYKVPQVARRLTASALLIGGWLVQPGCEVQVCPEDRLPAEYQLAPSGRAVALVDQEIFDSVVSWLDNVGLEPNPSFDCLVDFFTARFAEDVDIIMFVLDTSRDELFQLIDNDRIANFTVAQRTFETGIGSVQVPLVNPVGPPSMRGYSFLGTRDGLLAGPSLHEIAHGWCAYLDGPLALAEQIGRTPMSHWGFTSVGGVLGGWARGSLESLGGQKYRALAPTEFEDFAPQGYANNNIHYAPLELYLMGLIDPEEVPEIEVAISPVFAGDGDEGVTFFADAMETVSIAEIIGANGNRLPGVQESQKHFRIALVVIARDPLGEIEWFEYEDAMDCLSSATGCGKTVSRVTTGGEEQSFTPLSFLEATAGRGTLSFVKLQEPNDSAR